MLLSATVISHEDKCREFQNALKMGQIHYGITPYVSSYSVVSSDKYKYAKIIKYCPFCGEKID
jgi:hypothetical protein